MIKITILKYWLVVPILLSIGLPLFENIDAKAQSPRGPRVSIFRSDRDRPSGTTVNQYQDIVFTFRCLNASGGATIDNVEQDFHAAFPPPVGRMPNTGSVTTAPKITSPNSPYTLTCVGASAQIAQETISVTVIPTGMPNFSFSVKGGQAEVDFNTSVTLIWSPEAPATNITSCAASNNRPDYYNNWGSNGPLYAALPVPKSGERTIAPNILFGTTFTLTCYNGTGSTRIPASRQVIVTVKQAGNFVFGGNNKIQAAVFTNGSIGVRGGNDIFTGSFVAKSFNDLTNLVNIRFNYDYNLSRNWPPGFRYLNMPQPKAN
ncbi:MAG: hypothetical protein AAB881_00190 [Patescibacteria group bacterium]